MDNALTNGALRLHMYLSPGATSDKHSVTITKQAGNAMNTKAYGRKHSPPSFASNVFASFLWQRMGLVSLYIII